MAPERDLDQAAAANKRNGLRNDFFKPEFRTYFRSMTKRGFRLLMGDVCEELVHSAVLRGRNEHVAHSSAKEVSRELTRATERRLCDRGPGTQAPNAVPLEHVHRRQIWNGHDVEGHRLDGRGDCLHGVGVGKARNKQSVTTGRAAAR